MLFALSNNAIAESTSHKELVHFSAHFGLSYGINSISHAFLANILGVDNTLSMIAASVFTFGVGAAYKFSEIENGRLPGNFGKSMTYNAMGIGFSDLTILTFDAGSK